MYRHICAADPWVIWKILSPTTACLPAAKFKRWKIQKRKIPLQIVHSFELSGALGKRKIGLLYSPMPCRADWLMHICRYTCIFLAFKKKGRPATQGRRKISLMISNLSNMNLPKLPFCFCFCRRYLRIFSLKGIELKNCYTNSLLRRVNTNFWAKVAIEV